MKVAGQPKIDLKSFGEGKDLNFEITLDLLPEIKLQTLKNLKASNFSIKVGKKRIRPTLDNFKKEYKTFDNKKPETKSEIGDQVTFDYQATVDGKEFDGGKGTGVTIELGKDLFLKDFDKQLIGIKKMIKKRS